MTPDALPELRRAIDDTLKQLSPHLQRMQDEAFMEEAWLGDCVSHDSWRVYNEHVMASPDGPFQALIKYQQQLVLINEKLAEIQHNYDQTEAANTDLVRRMT